MVMTSKLQAAYKRQLDETNNRRFRTELELSVLKSYLTATLDVPSTGITENNVQESLTEALEELQKASEKVARLVLLRSSPSTHLVQAQSLIEEAAAIASGRMDILTIRPSRSSVGSLSLLLGGELGPVALISCPPEAVIDVDVQMLQKLSRLISKLLDIHGVTFKCVLQAIPNLLEVKMTEWDTPSKILWYQDAHTRASDLMTAADISSQQPPRLDDATVITLSILTLAQATGGDFNVNTDGFVLAVGCDDSHEPQIESQPLTASTLPPRHRSITPTPPTPHRPTTPPQTSTVPLDHPAVPEPNKPSTVADPLQGRVLNIMLVEDNPLIQRVFTHYWRSRNHNLIVASDGQQAIDKYKTTTFSIIFCDIELPIKKGDRVAREIRAYEAEKGRKRVPIIGMSGHTLKDYQQLAIDAGMDDFVEKEGVQMKLVHDLVIKYCAI